MGDISENTVDWSDDQVNAAWQAYRDDVYSRVYDLLGYCVVISMCRKSGDEVCELDRRARKVAWDNAIAGNQT